MNRIMGLKKPIPSPSKWYHEILIENNPETSTTAYSYFDIKCKPAISSVDGLHKEVETCDMDRLIIRVVNLDIQKKPTNCIRGWHLRERKNPSSDFTYCDASMRVLTLIIIGIELLSRDQKQVLLEDEDWIRAIQGQVVDTRVSDHFFKDLNPKQDGTLGSILSGDGLFGSDSKEYELIIQRGERILNEKIRRALLKHAELRLRWVPRN